MGESNFYSSRPGWTGAVFCAFGRVFAEGTNCMEQVRTENKMGTMPIGKLLANMAVPMMVSMLVQAFYNVVDSVYVSQLNENALSAISLAFPLQNLMIAFGSGTAVGTNALLSRALGAKRHDLVDRAANTSIFLMFCNFAIFCVLGLTLSRTFFLAQTDVQQIVDYGASYTSICLGASIGIFAQFCFERLLQSTGRTKLAMYTQIAGAVINIILDPILIFGWLGFPRMEVAGAALATVIGQIFAACLALFMNLKYNPDVRIRPSHIRFHWDTVKEIYRVGIPSIVMMSISSIMNFGLNQILIVFSTTATAVFGVYFKLQSFIFMPVFGLNNGMVPIIAYNCGAPGITVDGLPLARVTLGDVNTLDELRALLCEHVSAELADEWLATGRFVESDGALYAAWADRGSDITILNDELSATVIGSSGILTQRITRGDWSDDAQAFVPTDTVDTYEYPFTLVDGHAVFSAFPCPY